MLAKSRSVAIASNAAQTDLRLWDDSCSPFDGCNKTMRALGWEDKTVNGTNAVVLQWLILSAHR